MRARGALRCQISGDRTSENVEQTMQQIRRTIKHAFNFREIVSLFQKGDAIKIVTAETVGPQLVALLNQPEERKRLGGRAKDLFARHAGATRRTLDALGPLLAQRRDGR